MAMILEKERKTIVCKLKEERDFYLLIEQRLEQQGFELLDTSKKMRANDTFYSPSLSRYY